ncbi:MAG: FAD-dependent oxidoreductase [Enhydrobacter sp.]
MSDSFDLCIIGGGIIGCSTAYYAARAGLRTVLFERGELAGEASGINPGTVALATKAPGEHALMARASMRELARLDEAFGHSFDYVRAGSLVMIETADQRDFAVAQAEGLRQCGVDITVIDAAEARRIQPILEGPIAGALWSPRDVLVNSRKMTQAFARFAGEAGADVREQSPVEGVTFEAGRWNIRGAQGAVTARWLVNAAGVGAVAVGKWVGLEHAIFPRKGQLMATTPMPKAAPVRVTSVTELLRKQGRKVREYPGPPVDIGITPQSDGSVFIGGTQENVGLDTTLDPATLGTMASRAARLYPSFSDGAIVRAWCGFRPATPNGHPLVGTVDSCANYVIAGGHGGDGVALAPITGRYVADLVKQGGSAPSFGAYAKQLVEQDARDA